MNNPPALFLILIASFVFLTKGGLASSGDYERFMVVDDFRYSHILNLKTGWPVDNLACASVYAEQCIVARSTSTIAMLKDDDFGVHWLDEIRLPYISMS